MNALEDPEDTRVLAWVLDAQGTIPHRKRAIEVLESLVARSVANVEDRFLIARLYEIIGDWPKARERYRDLNLRTKNLKDLETLIRRPLYLAQFVIDLLRNHKAGDDQDLTEAQLVVDELKQLQPEQLNTLKLQVEVYKARKQLDKAADLIQTAAKRSDLQPIAVRTLAELAETLDRFDIAEPLYQRYAALLKSREARLCWLGFLAAMATSKMHSISVSRSGRILRLSRGWPRLCRGGHLLERPSRSSAGRQGRRLVGASDQTKKGLHAPAGCTGQLPGTAEALR